MLEHQTYCEMWGLHKTHGQRRSQWVCLQTQMAVWLQAVDWPLPTKTEASLFGFSIILIHVEDIQVFANQPHPGLLTSLAEFEWMFGEQGSFSSLCFTLVYRVKTTSVRWSTQTWFICCVPVYMSYIFFFTTMSISFTKQYCSVCVFGLPVCGPISPLVLICGAEVLSEV